jgi:hypothetical protein
MTGRDQARLLGPPELFLVIVIAVMAILFVTTLLFAIPKIIAGYGLRNEKSWARIWTIIACCMAVMSFPLGTALGMQVKRILTV